MQPPDFRSLRARLGVSPVVLAHMIRSLAGGGELKVLGNRITRWTKNNKCPEEMMALMTILCRVNEVIQGSENALPPRAKNYTGRYKHNGRWQKTAPERALMDDKQPGRPIIEDLDEVPFDGGVERESLEGQNHEA